MPNVVGTARFIFRITIIYLVAGTVVLTAALRIAFIGGFRAWSNGHGSFGSSPDRNRVAIRRPTGDRPAIRKIERHAIWFLHSSSTNPP